MEWKKIYEKAVDSLCKADIGGFDTIVELEEPKYENELIVDEKAPSNSLYKFRLPYNSSEEDYKKFCEFIYAYIGLDIEDYIKKNFSSFGRTK